MALESFLSHIKNKLEFFQIRWFEFRLIWNSIDSRTLTWPLITFKTFIHRIFHASSGSCQGLLERVICQVGTSHVHVVVPAISCNRFAVNVIELKFYIRLIMYRVGDDDARSEQETRAAPRTQRQNQVVGQSSSAPSLNPVEEESSGALRRIKTIREDKDASSLSPFSSPGKRSDMSVLSSPRGYNSKESAEKHKQFRTDPKKWVQNKEILIPKYDENEEDQALLKKDEESIWKELFPDGDMEDETNKEKEPTPDRKQRLKKFVKSAKFKVYLTIFVVQVFSLTAAIYILVYQPPKVTWTFQLWRIFFLVVLLPFTWIFGDFLCWLVIKFVERFLFNLPNALYFAYATKEPLKWVMRFLTLTIVWALMMTVETGEQLEKINTVYDYILKILGCITLFFTANFLKRFAAKSLALNLNKGTQQYKLEAALTKERILKTLLGNKKPKKMSYTNMKASILSSSTSVLNKMMKTNHGGMEVSDLEEGSLEQKSEEEEEENSVEEETDEDYSRKAKQDLQKKRKDVIVRLNLVETYIRNHAINVSFKDELNQRSQAKVENEMEAKRVGSFLYWNIKGSLDEDGITKQDLEEYLEKEDLDLAFAMLDINEDGAVSLKECIQAVDNIYVERKNLSKTLKDGRNITKTLENLIGAVIHTIFIFLYLLIFQANVGEIWVGFSGILLGFSFVFSRTVSDVFDNVIFLFGTHPYAIGDLLNVDSEQMSVEEITLNFTCMKTSSNRALWMPNQYLIKNPFTNLTASGNFFESVTVFIDMNVVITKPDLLSQIQQELEKAIHENSSEFGTTLRANYEFSEVPMKLGIKVVFEFSHSGVNFKRCSEARTIIHSAIARVLARENVLYTWPTTAANVGSQADQSMNTSIA